MNQVLDLVPIWTLILALAVFFYVLLDGFDLGVGMLFGFAPDTTSRNTIMNSIAALGNSQAQVLPFAGAILLFVLSYSGIAISLYPMIVPHHFTLWEAASSAGTQAFLLVGTLVLLPVIFM